MILRNSHFSATDPHPLPHKHPRTDFDVEGLLTNIQDSLDKHIFPRDVSIFSYWCPKFPWYIFIFKRPKP